MRESIDGFAHFVVMEKFRRPKEGEMDMCKALDDLYQDGVKKGENRYSQLILKLSELLVKAASDSDYRDSLYMKYNIK